jgi:hypothetical protein
MEEKIKRFITLSKEFTIDSEDIYKGFQKVSYNPAVYHGRNTINFGTCTESIFVNSLITESKLDQFEFAQLEKINKAKRFEEYLKLQVDLSEYYNALEKLQ